MDTALDLSSPEAKRPKLDKDESASLVVSTSPIEAILPDSLIKPIIYERCVISTLGDKRRLSEFIREINKAFPLPTFQHLKRVRNGQVLLFPVAMLINTHDVTDDDITPDSDSFRDQVRVLLIAREFPESLVTACSEFHIEEMTAVAPQLKSQYQEVMKRWPCKFHEDKDLERLSRNENFSQRETLFHCRMMRLCLDLRHVLQSESECVALAFDPTRNKIVALGWRPKGEDGFLNIIPSGHSVMRAIDNVAVAQGGGAWKDDADGQSLLEKRLHSAREQFKDFSDLHLTTSEELKYGSYLCTGFDMYLTDEPCLMCSMALVHSRVRRIFFKRNNVDSGALGGGTQLKLHGVRELNHHYQVFRVNKD